MPESVTDRCVKAHEYIFLLSKSKKYYFDYKAIQEDAVSVTDRRAGKGRFEYNGKRMAGGGYEAEAQRPAQLCNDNRQTQQTRRMDYTGKGRLQRAFRCLSYRTDTALRPGWLPGGRPGIRPLYGIRNHGSGGGNAS